jgi:hypothetical protein
MPLASDRQVNEKPFKIGMKSQNAARFDPLSWEMIASLQGHPHRAGSYDNFHREVIIVTDMSGGSRSLPDYIHSTTWATSYR